MADGDYERRGARDAELTRFKRIIAETRQHREQKADKAETGVAKTDLHEGK